MVFKTGRFKQKYLRNLYKWLGPVAKGRLIKSVQFEGIGDSKIFFTAGHVLAVFLFNRGFLSQLHCVCLAWKSEISFIFLDVY